VHSLRVLHDFVALSNHDHPVYTDPKANGPKFIKMLHSFVARALNCRWGEWDSFWSGQRHGALRLLESIRNGGDGLQVPADTGAAVLRRRLLELLRPELPTSADWAEALDRAGHLFGITLSGRALSAAIV
jgi:hypothetical protein